MRKIKYFSVLSKYILIAFTAGKIIVFFIQKFLTFFSAQTINTINKNIHSICAQVHQICKSVTGCSFTNKNNKFKQDILF